MKQLYAFYFLLAIPFFATAQVINFSDINFKNALLSSNEENGIAYSEDIGVFIVDTNQNGEIEQSEVTQITHLFIDNLEISSLAGIEYFTNLIQLNCQGNFITTLDLRNNTHLIQLECYNNSLTTLDIRETNVTWLYAFDNLISELLYDLDTPNWMVFNVASNQLNSIIIPRIHSWDEGIVDISENPITSVDFPAGMQLNLFACIGTQLTSLDLSNIGHFYDTLVIKDNTNLQYINLKNGDLDWRLDHPITNLTVDISNNPALQFICVDDDIEASFYQNFAPNVSSYCSFTPGGNHNTITGTIKFDMDSDGCTAGDAVAKSIKITDNYETSGSIFTNQNGQYNTFVRYENITLTPQLENPYYTVFPASFTSAFSGFGNTATADFCIIPNGIYTDLEVSIVPVNVARPGFDATYHIVYKNKGNQTVSGNVTLDFDDTLLDFVLANPVINTQSTNRLVWNLGTFVPFETKTITVTFNVNSPMETPAVNIDDILHFTATVSSAQTDETPLDNMAVLHQTVVGSFDPNDKLVAEGETIGTTDLDKYLHYTIRFQNTGTYEATNVVVSDVIQNQLDVNSLQIVSASHPYVAKMTNKKLEFIFEGINLPAASVDEPRSHGYATFKIKPAATVGLGSTMENIANIYFDYNFPIETNPVSTTITALNTSSFSKNDSFLIYPNPVKNVINVDSKNEIFSATIYNILGQIVKTFLPESYQTKIQIPAGELKAGTYLIEVNTINGKSSQQLIKL